MLDKEEKESNSQKDDTFVLDRWRSKPEDIERVLEHPETKELHLIWSSPETLDDNELDNMKSNDKLWEQNGVDLSVISQLLNLEVLVLKGVHTGHDGHWNFQLDLSALRDSKKLKQLRISCQFGGGSVFKKLDLSPLASCGMLEEFEMERTSLRYIDLTPLSQCANLVRISVAHNKQMAGITLPSNPNVKEIDLSHNSLITRWMVVGDYSTVITPRSLVRDGGSNVRKYAPEVILRPEKHCKMLSHDQLLNLEQLGNSKNLEKLDLSSNDISSIRLTFLYEREGIPIIDLRSNPLLFVNVDPVIGRLGRRGRPLKKLMVDDDVQFTMSDEVPSSP